MILFTERMHTLNEKATYIVPGLVLSSHTKYFQNYLPQSIFYLHCTTSKFSKISRGTYYDLLKIHSRYNKASRIINLSTYFR